MINVCSEFFNFYKHFSGEFENTQYFTIYPQINNCFANTLLVFTVCFWH